MIDPLTKEKADYAELTAWFAAWKDRPTEPFLLAPHANVAYPSGYFNVLEADIEALNAGGRNLRGLRTVVADLRTLHNLFGPK